MRREAFQQPLDRLGVRANLPAPLRRPVPASIAAEKYSRKWPISSIPIHDLDTQGKDFVFALDESWLERVLRRRPVFAATRLRARVRSRSTPSAMAARSSCTVGHAPVWSPSVDAASKTLPIEVELRPGCAVRTGRDRLACRSQANDDEDDDDIDPTQPDREFYTGDQVVIDDLVRDYLLLELPMQPRCDLGWSCPNLDVPEHMRAPEGVQSSKDFGEDSIDPRLAPLMKLAKKGERDKE